MFTSAGVLRLDDWTNLEGVYDNIRCINECYYDHIIDNLRYIQSRDKENYTIYSIELRDASSHFVKIFTYADTDVSLEDNRIKITRQLERYLGHLEELLYDTYLRVINFKVDALYKQLEGKINLPKKKMEYARQIVELRTVRDDITIEQKIVDYKKILKSIEKDGRAT